MAKSKEKVEFRYYEIPEDCEVLALLGEDWIREYGDGIDYLHFHNHMEIGYCHWGSGEVMLGQENLPFRDGSVMIVPPRLPHTTNSAPGTKSYWEWMYVDLGRFLGGMHREDPLVRKNPLKRVYKTGYLLDGETCLSLAAITKSIMEEMREKKPYYKECVRGFLYSWTVELLRLTNEEDRVQMTQAKAAMIATAMEYVASHYMEEIKIVDLADACSMSESHFRRVFEEGMQMRPGDYVNLVRVQNACELLKRTNKSMEEVAAATGFASISAFNRNFRKILERSPYQWKKSSENYESNLLNYKISAKKGW